MKRFSKVSKVVATILIGGMLGASLTGCGRSNEGNAVKKNATEVIKEFSAAVEKDNNYKALCNMKLNVSSKDTNEKLNANVAVTYEKNKDFEHTVTKSESSGLSVSSESEEVYIEKTDKGYKSYTSLDSDSGFTVDDYDSEDFDDFLSGLSFKEQEDTIAKYFTIKDKTVNHDGKECYQIDFSISSEDASDILSSEQDILPSSLFLSGADYKINSTVYISTDYKYFSFSLDKNNFDVQKIADSLGGKVSIDEFTIGMNINVGAVTLAAVPEDVKKNAIDKSSKYGSYEVPGEEDIYMKVGETKTFELPSAYNMKDMTIEDFDDGEYVKMEISGDKIKVTALKPGLGLITATKKGNIEESYDFWIDITR